MTTTRCTFQPRCLACRPPVKSREGKGNGNPTTTAPITPVSRSYPPRHGILIISRRSVASQPAFMHQINQSGTTLTRHGNCYPHPPRFQPVTSARLLTLRNWRHLLAGVYDTVVLNNHGANSRTYDKTCLLCHTSGLYTCATGPLQEATVTFPESKPSLVPVQLRLFYVQNFNEIILYISCTLHFALESGRPAKIMNPRQIPRSNAPGHFLLPRSNAP